MSGMRKALAWVALAAAIVVALAAAYAAYQTADYAWSQVVDYDSPFTDAVLPAASAGPPMVDRVVFVLIDGLRDDTSRTMDSLERLRQYGADFTVQTPQPSLSYPTWTTVVSGAPNSIHGVTTNWWEGPVEVETILDTVRASGKDLVVSAGSEGFGELFRVEADDGHVFLKDWEEGDYLSGEVVDHAIEWATESRPGLVFVYLPDLDEAGHSYGPESEEYAEVAARIDADLARLISALEDSSTAFVVTADHGHIEGGGHGGPEYEATHPPLVMAGGPVALSRGEALQTDIAPTVAVMLGVPVPRNATGSVIEEALADAPEAGLRAARVERATALSAYFGGAGLGESFEAARSPESLLTAGDDVMDEMMESARDAFARRDRSNRLGQAALVAGLAVLALAVIGIASWRALVAALAGGLTYSVLYNALYFVLHGHRWSLSAFNEEGMIDAFFYTRMGEAVLAVLIGAAVAGFVYVALRRSPKPARGEYLAGWLALGPATVVATQALLALQLALYLWLWGIEVRWWLPDLVWGFKFDLDLVQTTAVGAAALLAWVVTWLVGRYHPVFRTVRADE